MRGLIKDNKKMNKNVEAPVFMPFQPRDTLHPPTFFSVSSIKKKKRKRDYREEIWTHRKRKSVKVWLLQIELTVQAINDRKASD